MSNAHYFILYVDSPVASAAFYEGLLGKAPFQSSPTFAMFVLQAGAVLALWARSTVQPAAPASGIEGEFAIKVDTVAAVDAAFADWKNRNIEIAQPPADLDFGRAFTALDPDGHRLRVFATP